MTGRPEDHDELLRELRSLADDPAEAEELIRTAGLLDTIGAEEREDLEAVGEMEPASWEHRVDEILGTKARGRNGGADATARTLRVLAGIAAAAAVLLLALYLWPGAKEEDPGSVLGDGKIELVAPAGDVDAWGEFRWTGPDPGRGRYEVLIYRGDDPAAPPIARGTNLKELRWVPTEDTGAWPAEILWEVRLLDQTGELEASADARARLR